MKSSKKRSSRKGESEVVAKSENELTAEDMLDEDDEGEAEGETEGEATIDDEPLDENDIAAEAENVGTEVRPKRRRPSSQNEKDLAHRLGKAIQHKREYLGLTTLSLAKVLDVDISTYRKTEAGTRRLSPYEFIKLMKVLQIKDDCIYDQIDIKKEQENLKEVLAENRAELDEDINDLERRVGKLRERKDLMARVITGAEPLPS